MKSKTNSEAQTARVFGWDLILDLYECDAKTISDGKAIRKFAKELCQRIDMKPYGKAQTPYFGEKQEHTKGYSLLQFIETSSITGHFSEATGAVYLNVFSCKEYDEKAAKAFAKEFFGAKKVKARFITRV